MFIGVEKGLFDLLHVPGTIGILGATEGGGCYHPTPKGMGLPTADRKKEQVENDPKTVDNTQSSAELNEVPSDMPF